MDKNRVIADLNLINELLNCPSGEEAAILQANQELVDTDFVLVMQQAATKLAADGNQESADFLQGLANQVSRMLIQGPEAANLEEHRTQAYLNLIDQLIGCPNGKEPDVLGRPFRADRSRLSTDSSTGGNDNGPRGQSGYFQVFNPCSPRTI